jgi:very-short-patch-repair endonuclease
MAFSGMTMAKRHAIFVSRLKKQATPAERRFCCRLEELGLTYRFQQGFYHPFYRIADFYLPDLKLIIEIDGRYHDAEEDRRKDAAFEAARGIKILRLTNEQVMSGAHTRFCTDFVPMIRHSCESRDSGDLRNQ